MTKPTPIQWNEKNKTYLLTHTLDEIKKRWPNHQPQSLQRAQRRFRQYREQTSGIKVPKSVSLVRKIGKAPTPYRRKILIYDIETSYLIGKAWGLYQQDLIGGYSGLFSDYQILSIAWTWFDENKENQHVFVKGQDDFENYVPGVNDDTEIVKFIHALFDEADIVIAHNGNSFDQKKCRARFVQRGLLPHSPVIEVDTKLMARKIGGFTSNKLGDLAKMLGVEAKGDPGGIQTWDGCLNGDPIAWKKMKQYNKQDIPPLVGIYKVFRAWVPNHPAVNLINRDFDACPKCGGLDLQKRGLAYTKTNTYQRLWCKSCGGWSKSRAADKSTQKVLAVN